MVRPWSSNQLKRLGEAIRDGRAPAPNLPSYQDVISVYNDAAAEVQREIASIDFESILGESFAPEITSRAKTIDTLREKLIRDHGMALPSIQDVAGVRLDAPMLLSQQDLVAAAIARHFGDAPRAVIKDLRSTPHSGYRAVHVWLRLDQRVEIQVRTALQSEWANLYEALGDHYGRGIRYGVIPADPEGAQIVRSLQEFSTQGIADAEDLFERISHRDGLEVIRQLARERALAPGIAAIVGRGLDAKATIALLEMELQGFIRDVRYAFQDQLNEGE